MSNAKLTLEQNKLLEKEFWQHYREHGHTPLLKEMAEKYGVSKSTISKKFKTFQEAKEGFLTFTSDIAEEAISNLENEDVDQGRYDIECLRENWYLAIHDPKTQNKSSLLLKTPHGYLDLRYRKLFKEGSVKVIPYFDIAAGDLGIELPEQVSYNQISELNAKARNSDAKKK